MKNISKVTSSPNILIFFLYYFLALKVYFPLISLHISALFLKSKKIEDKDIPIKEIVDARFKEYREAVEYAHRNGIDNLNNLLSKAEELKKMQELIKNGENVDRYSIFNQISIKILLHLEINLAW